MKVSRAERRAETRTRLYESALAEFQRGGVAGAQIDRIATAAGVVRGTFYFHFPTKEHVLLELQRRHETRLCERLERLADSAPLRTVLETVGASIQDDEAWDRTPGLMREMIAMYARQPRIDQVGTGGPSSARPPRGLRASDAPGPRRPSVAPFGAGLPRADPLVRAIGRRFAAAAARGELCAGLEPARLGFTFLTSLLGLLLISANEPRGRRGALATLIDVFAVGASRRPGLARRRRVGR
jgi:AcrR family transcriptional regulator